MDGIRGSPLRKSLSKQPIDPHTQSPSPSPNRKKKTPDPEEKLGLLQNRNDPMSHFFNSDDPKTHFSLQVDSAGSSTNSPSPPPNVAGNGVWRDSSYDFHNDVVPGKKTTGPRADEEGSGEFDFPKQKDEPDLENQCLSPVPESPSTEYGKITPRAKVSFRESEMVQRRRSSGPGAVEEDQVVHCSSSSTSLRQKSGLLAMKTKSRLLDPPEDIGSVAIDKKSGRVTRSGFIGKTEEIEEEDPFLDEDFPEEYKKMKFSWFSIIQWVSLILITAALVCSVVIPALRKETVWDMQLWKWGVMILVLICGGLVSGWLIRIVVFFIERNFLLRKRVLYFVYGLRNSVQNFLWLGLVLLAWVLILDRKVEKETNSTVLPYVTKILICFMVGTLIWLVKTLLLKVLAMNFHVSAFFDRIQEALFNQYVIETLSGPPYLEIQRIQDEEERVMSEVQKLQNAGVHVPPDLRANCLPNDGKMVGSGRSTASGVQRSPFIGKSPKSGVIGKSPRFSRASSKREEKHEEEGISIDHLHRLNQKNVSAWNMKRLMNSVRKGVLSTLDEKLDSVIDDESALQIRSEKEAKAAAKRIFNNVARPGLKYIYLEDLMRFLREDEARRTMRLMEGSADTSGKSKGIGKRALKNWVVNVFRERRALALSLNDTKTAVNKLHQLVNVIVGIAIIIIWLLILGVPVTHFLVFVSSQVVVLAFMIGNTCKTTFEAIIFLFVMHPFDVGDRCEIEGVQMVVEEMNILTTVFLRYDNQKIVYPNSVLATKPISNYYRSPDMGDSVDFCVHISTPVEKIAIMKERITRYIESRKDHWYPSPMVVMRDVEDMNRIKFSVWLSHTMNHQDMGERWARRALLVEEMVKIFRELDIEYRMLPMDVNVRTMPPVVSDRLPSNWTTCAK